MRCRGFGFGLPWLLLLAGCAPPETRTTLVAPIEFDNAPPAARHTAAYTAASVALAARVDGVGRKLEAANKQCGLAPLFFTVQAPKAEIFHEGTHQVVITAALVDQCKTDGQLAAVLASEMARMVVEREAQLAASVRQPKPLPPMQLNIGSSGGGSLGPADQTSLAEMARFHPPGYTPPPQPLPDPNLLTRRFLHNAQFAEAELDQAAPLLAAAAANNDFERQMTTTPDSRAWTRQQ